MTSDIRMGFGLASSRIVTVHGLCKVHAKEPEYEFPRSDLGIIAVLREREATSAETDSSRGQSHE
jgi:hypothetical protein